MDDTASRFSKALDGFLPVVLPVVIIGSAFVPGGSGPPAVAAKVAAPVLAGLGLFPVVFSRSGRMGAVLALLLIGATCAGVVAGARDAEGPVDLATATAWIGIAFAALFGMAAPLLALGWRALASIVWLFGAAASCGSLLLPRESGSIPPPLLAFNPLVRILWHGLRFDWLHSGNMYPRVGTVFYSYPGRSEGVLAAIVVAGSGAAIAAMMALALKKRRADAEAR